MHWKLNNHTGERKWKSDSNPTWPGTDVKQTKGETGAKMREKLDDRTRIETTAMWSNSTENGIDGDYKQLALFFSIEGNKLQNTIDTY